MYFSLNVTDTGFGVGWYFHSNANYETVKTDNFCDPIAISCDFQTTPLMSIRYEEKVG
jgi:hypothetical protein